MKKYIASFIIACTTALSVQAQECSLPIGIAFQSGASAIPPPRHISCAGHFVFQCLAQEELYHN